MSINMETYIKMYVMGHILYSVSCENRLVRNFDTTVAHHSVSPNCQQTLSLFSDRLNETNVQNEYKWALEMLDATSKMPVSHNFWDIGRFKQCTDIESKSDHIMGKYCLGYIVLNSTIANDDSVDTRNQGDLKLLQEKVVFWMHREGYPTWAICLPSNCTDEDAVEVITQKLEKNVAFVICQTIDDVYPPIDGDAIIGIFIISLLVFIVFISTVYDLHCQRKKKEIGHPGFIAFSLHTNGKKLFGEVSKRSSPLGCLDGIKVISMIWILIFHVLATFRGGLLFNSRDEVNINKSLLYKFILNGHLACDTFFIVGGTLVTYLFFKKGKYGEITFCSVTKHYVHRYIRLAPPLAGIVLIHATLLKYMTSGPKWAYMVNVGYCTKYWWSSLLFIQNEVNVDQMCTLSTWYLDVDMQLYILSPLIFWMLKKYTKTGIVLLVLSTLASIATVFVRTFFEYGFSETLSKIHHPDDENYDYYKTKTRAAPWLIGTILGYMLTRRQFTRTKLPKIIVILGWSVSLAVMLLCVLGNHSSFIHPEYYRLQNALYSALSRPVFALGVGWVSWACATNNGGIINTMLSSSVFQFLNKFIYSMYIIHSVLLFVMANSLETPKSITLLNLAFWFWAIFMLTFGLSIISLLVLEHPMENLEKIMFKKNDSASSHSNNVHSLQKMKL